MQKSLELVPEEVLEIICVSHQSSGDLKTLSCKRKKIEATCSKEQFDNLTDLKDINSIYGNPFKIIKQEENDCIKSDNTTNVKDPSPYSRIEFISQNIKPIETENDNFEILSAISNKHFELDINETPDTFTIFDEQLNLEDKRFTEADTANFENISPSSNKQFELKIDKTRKSYTSTIYDNPVPSCSKQITEYKDSSDANNAHFEKFSASNKQFELKIDKTRKSYTSTIYDNPVPSCSKQIITEYKDSTEANNADFEKFSTSNKQFELKIDKTRKSCTSTIYDNPVPSCSKQITEYKDSTEADTIDVENICLSFSKEDTESLKSENLSVKIPSDPWSGVQDLRSLVWGAHNSTMNMEERRKYLAEPPVWPPGIRKSIRYKDDPPPP